MTEPNQPQRTGAEWLELLLDDLAAAARERMGGRMPVAAVLVVYAQNGPDQEIARTADGAVVRHDLEQIGLARLDTSRAPAEFIMRELLTYAAVQYAQANEPGNQGPLRGEVN